MGFMFVLLVSILTVCECVCAADNADCSRWLSLHLCAVYEVWWWWALRACEHAISEIQPAGREDQASINIAQ